jgi:putative addiction module component (TIGR02574 family)
VQFSHDDTIRLCHQERLDQVQPLWDCLSDPDVPLTPAQQAELERRIETLDRDRTGAVTGDSLRAELGRRD